MIFRTPFYYNDFQCIADKCRDNCCIGWEIDIDQKTAAHYASVQGAFGDRLKEHICFGDISCFILDEQERCPFLNDRNLCDIYTHLGESALCQICTDHPRFYEWFGDIKEGGIGMCCEEAARIILTQDASFSVTETEIPDEECDPCDDDMFRLLTGTRERIFRILHDENLPLSERFGRVLDLTATQQELTDNEVFTMPEDAPILPVSQGDMETILRFLQTLEPIDRTWQPTLSEAIGKLPEIAAQKERFLNENPQIPKYLRNIVVYFIWRYFLKGCFDMEYLSRASLAVVSPMVIAVLYAAKWLDTGKLSTGDCAEIAKNYSKEIEYSEENLNAVLDAVYALPAMNPSCLKGLLQ